MDLNRAKEAILSRLDILAEFERLGLKVAGNVRDDGFAACYAAGRHDTTPSGWINIQTGRYGDSAGGESGSLFDFAIQHGGMVDFQNAMRHYAERAGVDLAEFDKKTGSAKGKGKKNAAAKTGSAKRNGKPGGRKDASATSNSSAASIASKFDFLGWNDGYRNFVRQWCQNVKPGVTLEAIEAAGGQIVRYYAKKRGAGSQSQISIAIPGYDAGSAESDPVCWTIWLLNGGLGGSYGKYKMLTIGPSRGAVMGLDSLRALWARRDDESTSKPLVWKTAGPADMLAMWSLLPPGQRDSNLIISNADGEDKWPSAAVVELLCGFPVVIVNDCDDAGRLGARKWREKFKAAAPVRRLVLPLEYRPSGGPDLRDWINAGGQWEELRQMVRESAMFDGYDADGKKVGQAWDDESEQEFSRKVLRNRGDVEEPATDDDQPDGDDEPDGDEQPAGFDPDDESRPIRNARWQKGSGDSEGFWEALSVGEMIQDVWHVTDNWPRVASGGMFVPSKERGVDWISSSSDLFSWLGEKSGKPTEWRRIIGAVTKEEAFSALKRRGKRYDAVEYLPHEPMFDSHYYACPECPSGEGRAVMDLLAKFEPSTELDRDLILACLMTLFWGGSYGSRPAFLFTSEEGRGAGKSTAAEMVAKVAGGSLAFSKGDDWSRVMTRLLSPEALGKRVALLDNVKSPNFSWAELEGMITTETISGHRMFEGEGRRPNTLTWFITLNGASLSTDLAQRVIVIKLGRPVNNESWKDDIQNFIGENRDAIIGDILGILRGPRVKLKRYSRWATWERDIVGRLLKPDETHDLIISRQQSADVEAEESELIESIVRHHLDDLHYDVEVDSVFIPTLVITDWINKGLSGRDGATKISRHLRQLIRESRFKYITEHRTNQEKGFAWFNVGDFIRMDIRERIENRFKRPSDWE